jgi:hypothetical protein
VSGLSIELDWECGKIGEGGAHLGGACGKIGGLWAGAVGVR